MAAIRGNLHYIHHNSWSEGIIKFVWSPLYTHKPPLQGDMKLISVLNRLMSAILQQMVVIGNLCSTKCIAENSLTVHSN